MVSKLPAIAAGVALRSGAWKMATVRKEFSVSAAPEKVWDALRDFGALHTKLARGL